MSKKDLLRKVETIKALEAQKKALEEEIESLKDDVKAELNKKNTEELVIEKYIIRWTSILSSRFDTKRFKTELGEDLYKKYCKEVESRRFTIS